MTLTYATPNETPAPSVGQKAETGALDAQDKLRRIGRTTFKIGSVTFIFIGVMHTFVQLTDMAATDIRGSLEAIGAVDNVSAGAWDLWQGLGLLMGFFAVALGLSNLAGLKGRIDDYPAAGVCAVNILMLTAIATVGYLHLGPIQLIGGPVGMVMFTIPLIANRKR